MRVVNNILTKTAKSTNYGTAVRRVGETANLYIVVDFFTGDSNVRLVNLATGKIIKVPDDEILTIVDNAYIDIDNGEEHFEI